MPACLLARRQTHRAAGLQALTARNAGGFRSRKAIGPVEMWPTTETTETLDTIKHLTKHMYHPQQIHWVVQVAIISIFRYSAAIANWDSQEIVKLENLCGNAKD